MKSISVGVAGRQAGLALALVLSVTLATLLFNFLGTIACGALVGMMLSATRRWQWRVILVSLVFPGVIGIFLQVSRSDLTSRQMVLLPVVCFGSFWVTYLSTCLLLRFEKPSEAVNLDLGSSPPPSAAAAVPVSTPPATKLSGLDELQGAWLQAATEPTAGSGRKRLEFRRDHFAVSVVAGSDVRLVSQGTVSVERVGPLAILKLLDARKDQSAGPGREPDASQAWIYRLADSKLVIAINFEEAACGGVPMLETYSRLND